MDDKIKNRLYDLQTGDIIEHIIYGDLTILEKDAEETGYIVLFGTIVEKGFISYAQVLMYCRIKS